MHIEEIEPDLRVPKLISHKVQICSSAHSKCDKSNHLIQIHGHQKKNYIDRSYAMHLNVRTERNRT